MAIYIPGSGGGGGGGGAAASVWPGFPGGTGWIVGFNDFTSDEVFSSGGSYPFGPFWTDVAATGSGTSRHYNTNIAGTYGVREDKINNTVGAIWAQKTDGIAATFAEGTFRVGIRWRLPTLPVSGGNDCEGYIGFGSHINYPLSGTDYAAIGFDLSKNATNWVIVTKDGTTENITDSGVALAADTCFNIEIECSPTYVSAWIDGTKVLDASTTNIPRTSEACVTYTPTYVRVGTPTDFFYALRDWSYVAFKPASARGSLDSASGPWA